MVIYSKFINVIQYAVWRRLAGAIGERSLEDVRREESQKRKKRQRGRKNTRQELTLVVLINEDKLMYSNGSM